MSESFIPRLAAPVERTITGGPPAEQAGVEQAATGRTSHYPFADEGDE
ncbi:hypothetical protein [Streptosporangium jomthongense]|uniref:Uncharacterized protein n=1 Tax=Streptosporangium jomthongense TaxID=1193683 RepID=A0ABV8F7Z6_9ACTN